MSQVPWYQAKGYWKTLSLNDNATVKEVRSAYLKLCLKHHPDKVPVSERKKATENFKVIKNAYDFCLVSATIRPTHDKLNPEPFHLSSWSHRNDRSNPSPWPKDDDEYDEDQEDDSNSSPWPEDEDNNSNTGSNSSTSSPPPPPPPKSKPHYPNPPARIPHGTYAPPRASDIDEDACFTDAEADVWVHKKLANKTWRHAINKKHLDLFLARKKLETFERQMAAASARAPNLDDRPKYDGIEVEDRRRAMRKELEAEVKGLEADVAEQKGRQKAKKPPTTGPKGVLPGDKAMMDEGYTRDQASGWQKAMVSDIPPGDADEPVDFQRGRALRVVVTTAEEEEEEEFWDSLGEESWA